MMSPLELLVELVEEKKMKQEVYDMPDVTIAPSHTTYENKGIPFYRAAVMKSSLELLIKGIRPSRNYTLTNVLKITSEYTGKQYKVSKKEAKRAIDDLSEWISKKQKELQIVIYKEVE